uniref:Guanosine-3',5'-bis(diphosphate) 3'-pyrophosphohydrolase MESH1 n=1 Tax=Anopheles darlingi TaxID=43151 RepID=A0A2M4CTZ5_ANODA
MASAKSPQDLLVAYTKCVNFAAIKHRDQRRLDKEETPYINHPIGVANILSSEGGINDFDVLSAAILHDTVEDTETTFEEIEKHFGPTIRSLVQEVTDDKSLPKQERKRLQIEHARTISHGARLVKLADKIYNLRDLQRCPPKNWTDERCREYFRWAKQVCDNLKGTNEPLERILDDIFRQENVI